MCLEGHNPLNSMRKYTPYLYNCTQNRPFPSSRKHHFQSDIKCNDVYEKMSYSWMRISSPFGMNTCSWKIVSYIDL